MATYNKVQDPITGKIKLTPIKTPEEIARLASAAAKEAAKVAQDALAAAEKATADAEAAKDAKKEATAAKAAATKKVNKELAEATQ